MPPKAACIPTTDPSDSALIALCNEFLRRNVEIPNLGSTKELSDRLFIRLARATLSQRALLADIAALPVSSLEGWRNRFKVAVTCSGPFEISESQDVQHARATMVGFVWQTRT